MLLISEQQLLFTVKSENVQIVLAEANFFSNFVCEAVFIIRMVEYNSTFLRSISGFPTTVDMISAWRLSTIHGIVAIFSEA